MLTVFLCVYLSFNCYALIYQVSFSIANPAICV